MLVSLVVAVSQNNVIGKCQRLPWHLPADLAHFKQVTLNHHILMGRKTWDSLPFKPLPSRVSIVVTNQASVGTEEGKSLKVVNSLSQGIEFAKSQGETELMVIGGSEIYNQSLQVANKLYITRVHADIDGDVFFPNVDWTQWTLLNSVHHPKDDKNEYDFSIETYQRK